jgi:hypothetical protein
MGWSTNKQLYRGDLDMMIERHATLLIGSRLDENALADLKVGESNTVIQFVEAGHDEIAQSAASIFGMGINSEVCTKTEDGSGMSAHL